MFEKKLIVCSRRNLKRRDGTYEPDNFEKVKILEINTVFVLKLSGSAVV